MKTAIQIILIVAIASCNKGGDRKTESIELIAEAAKQDSIFKNLMYVTNNTISSIKQQDSLAFLLLPVQASCPACRKKTIDSIIKHQNSLRERNFIIISASGGRKTISSFFREQNYELPYITSKLFLDTTNEAYKYELYKDKPTIYYTYNYKAYKKVSAIPITVKEDLREFFSGHRKENKN